MLQPRGAGGKGEGAPPTQWDLKHTVIWTRRVWAPQFPTGPAGAAAHAQLSPGGAARPPPPPHRLFITEPLTACRGATENEEGLRELSVLCFIY